MGRRSAGRGRSIRYGDSRHGRVSMGGILTGLMVGVSATYVFALITGAVLQALDHDLHKVVSGNTSLASAGAGTAFVLAVFLSFMWGGYTSGRMGGGMGAVNGALVPTLALTGLAIGAVVVIGVQGIDEVTLPFGVGTLPLDGNFTPLGLAVVAGAAVGLVAGGVWGGVIGGRWHVRINNDYYPTMQSSTPETFSDLSGRTAP